MGAFDNLFSVKDIKAGAHTSTMSEKRYPISYRAVYFQLRVDDLERAKKFYEEVFGLAVS